MRLAILHTNDWELDPFSGLALAGRRLKRRYDFPTSVREAIEEDLR